MQPLSQQKRYIAKNGVPVLVGFSFHFAADLYSLPTNRVGSDRTLYHLSYHQILLRLSEVIFFLLGQRFALINPNNLIT